MFTHLANVRVPVDATPIWRYVSLEKLVAMLASRELPLVRLDKFGDPWEAAWTEPVFQRAALAMTELPQAKRDHFLSRLRGHSVDCQKALFASCWHMSDTENAGLWRLYSGVAGVAIKSTFGRLTSSIATELALFPGCVEYKDHNTHDLGDDALRCAAFLKRRSFEHEAEFRLVACEWPIVGDELRWSAARPAIGVPVNLSRLIEHVYISPWAPEWLDPHIPLLLERLGGIAPEVSRSPLLSPQVI